MSVRLSLVAAVAIDVITRKNKDDAPYLNDYEKAVFHKINEKHMYKTFVDNYKKNKRSYQ